MDGRSRIADLVERGVVVSPTLIMDYQDSDAYDGILLQASQMLEAVGEQPQPEPDSNDDDILLQASQMFEAVEHEEKEVKLSRGISPITRCVVLLRLASSMHRLMSNSSCPELVTPVPRELEHINVFVTNNNSIHRPF